MWRKKQRDMCNTHFKKIFIFSNYIENKQLAEFFFFRVRLLHKHKWSDQTGIYLAEIQTNG